MLSLIKGKRMKKAELALPEIVLIAGTRALLGAGIALLFGGRLNENRRRTVGLTLSLIGLISTVPLLIDVFSKRR